ncbi:glycosyltransferase family 2 protein [Limnohabitans sp. WS1]|uniref:glycosyltransferase family 2 protein n=1 Tax=Limnohabitans sp. WS1 TaxID=1100726 RepID=UPI00210526FF|nr:glycosyltransferase family 2 protein [Limnohabitans sp. WS1]
MISLNEAHNMDAVLQNLAGWAQQVFLVDSCSSDDTVSTALRHGVHVVQRRFKGFGDQWNFALNELPITAPWTMKLDPDERLTDELKASIQSLVASGDQDGIIIKRRLWFMGSVLPVQQPILRVWRTGTCRFTDVAVNEHPLVKGRIGHAKGILEHHDSPDLDHWLTKQNRYTTAEAISQFEGRALALPPRFFGTALERRMWFKCNFWKVPGRYLILFLYHLLVVGAWRAGRVGWVWARLRTEVYRMWEYKRFEMDCLGHVPAKIPANPGLPDPRVQLYD